MLTSSFHLWQFQVFNSGAVGLEVVLFWFHMWEIFLLPSQGFELGTSGSPVLHSNTAPWWLLVFTSDNLSHLTLVQRDWWWYWSDWTCDRFSFCPHWSLNPGPLDLQSCTPTLHHGDFWFLPLTISSHLTLVQRDWWWYWSDWTCDRFYFFCTGVWTGAPGYLVLHSTTVPQQLLVFTSDTFSNLTLVQRKWRWYCSDCTCDQFSVSQHQVLKWIPLDL